MTNVVFIHGINTRGTAYDTAFDQVRSALAMRKPGTLLVPCRWGDDLGAALKGKGASIPQYDTTRAIRELETREVAEPELWELLDQDPLFELRVLALRPAPPPGEFDPLGIETPPKEIGRRIQECTDPERLKPMLKGTGLSEAEVVSACRDLTNSPVFADALTASTDDLEDFPRIWARAIVASAMTDSPGALIASDARLRDALVARLAEEVALEAQARGLVSNWLTHALCVFGTGHVQDRRGRYTDFIVPIVGDVLVYQGHGESIRERIRGSIPSEGQVVLLAHSLGGIASVDLLVEAKLSQVKLLVTVGSQTPLMYEMDALRCLRFGEPLPPHFPRWLNLYDPRDFLSYVAAKVFASSPRGIVDVEVNNRQPFVRSHSAYWTNPETWDAIVPELP